MYFKKFWTSSSCKWCPSLPDIDIKCPEQTYQSRRVQDKKSMEHKEEDQQNLCNERKRGHVLDQEKKSIKRNSLAVWPISNED